MKNRQDSKRWGGWGPSWRRVALPAWLLLLVAIGISLARGAEPARLEQVFQEALMAEEARQDLATAIKGYESVVKAMDEQRRFAATAVFRLGECYRKLGRTNEAVAQYRQLLANYPGEKALADLSVQNLRALGESAVAGPVVAGAGTNRPTVTTAASDPDAPLPQEQEEIELFRRMLRESPDEAQRRMNSRLRTAAKDGKYWMSAALLKAGADPNAGSNDGTPLILAAEAGRRRVVELLIQSGAEVNRVKGPGLPPASELALGRPGIQPAVVPGQSVPSMEGLYLSPLGAAVRGGNPAVAALLIEKGADVNLRFGDETALHLAVANPNPALFKLLLERGANVNATNRLGSTPLHLAAIRRMSHASAALIRAGADLSKRTAEFWGKRDFVATPLDLAISVRDSVIIEQLISAGARYDYDYDDPSPIYQLLEDRPLLDKVMETATPAARVRCSPELLSMAIRDGDSARLKTLLAQGHLPDKWDSGGDPMLIVLLNHRDVAECDEDLPAPTFAPELGRAQPEQRTPGGLGMPVGVPAPASPVAVVRFPGSRAGSGPRLPKAKVLDLMKVLLDARANANATNREGQTALHRAAGAAFTEAIELLVRAGARGDIEDSQYRTPYFWMRLRVGVNGGPFQEMKAEAFYQHPAVKAVLSAPGNVQDPWNRGVCFSVEGTRYAVNTSYLTAPASLAQALLLWPEKVVNFSRLDNRQDSYRQMRPPSPNLNGIKIRRGGASTAGGSTIEIPPNWWKSTNCDWNVMLEAGDIVQFEEVPVVAGTVVKMLTEEVAAAMDRCTSGEVTLKSPVGIHRFEVHPALVPPGPKSEPTVSQSPTQFYTKRLGPLTVSAALNGSPVAPPGSQVKAIRWTRGRPGKDGKPIVQTIDATSSEAAKLILEPGDTIEIPAK